MDHSGTKRVSMRPISYPRVFCELRTSGRDRTQEQGLKTYVINILKNLSPLNFNFVLPCIIVQVKWKHQLDATLCRFYFYRVTLHVSGASAHHQEYLELVQRPLVHVLSLQVSHHISLLGPAGYNITQSSAPDDGHMVARNMLSNY